MAARKTYSDKLQDPRWQKKRLVILQRDGFTCQSCCDMENTLHVHHRLYISGRDPWDYPDGLLVTLCKDCHERERIVVPNCLAEIEDALKEKFLADDIVEITSGLAQVSMVHMPAIVANVIGWALQDEETMRLLLDRYLEGASEKYLESLNGQVHAYNESHKAQACG
jgi:hypothetical protein